MKSITSFNGWMLGKIVKYLSTKEGCEIERSEYTPEGARTIFKDAFGYRYEVRIEMLSRLHDSPQAFVEEGRCASQQGEKNETTNFCD